MVELLENPVRLCGQLNKLYSMTRIGPKTQAYWYNATIICKICGEVMMLHNQPLKTHIVEVLRWANIQIKKHHHLPVELRGEPCSTNGG